MAAQAASSVLEAATAAVHSRDRGVWAGIVSVLPTFLGPHPRALDCGGGSGSLAVPLALAGVEVTVLDSSAEALGTLARRAEEAGVGALIRGVQGDVEDEASFAPESFQLVLAHRVLDVVADPVAVVNGLCATLAPGAVLSVTVANPIAVVLSRAVTGEVEAALAALRDSDGTDELDQAAVRRACDAHGLDVLAVRGIGVVSDLISGSAQVSHPQALAALVELEEALSGRAPYRDIATRVQVIARRRPPGG